MSGRTQELRRNSRPNYLSQLLKRREAGLLTVLAAVALLVTLRNADFLAVSNLGDILINCTQPAIVACGVMLVVVMGEIDISVGSSLGLLSAVLGWLVSPTHYAWPVWAGILFILGLGGLIGAVNGLLVAVVRVPSIIVTLGMLTALRGVTVVLMKGGDITDMPAAVRFFGIGHVLGVSTSIWVAAVVLAATWAMIRYTPLGRRIYASGSNPEGARLAGLSVGGLKVLAFTLTGLLVGIATVVTQLATVNTGIGQGFELLVVTCVVVGGVSISGGTGTVIGVALAVLLLQIQSTALILMKLGNNAANWNRAIQGALILVAVLVDHLAGGRAGGRRGSA